MLHGDAVTSPAQDRGALAPDCYVCRLLVGPMMNLGKDDTFIIGFVTGYAEARTRDTIDWFVPDVCVEHARKFEKVMASVAKSIAPSRGRAGK